MPIFDAIASLAAHFRRRSIAVRQVTLLRLIRERTGRAMSRATLKRHLRALQRMHVLNREQPNTRNRDGTLRFRATVYTFGLRGQQWITRIPDRLAIAFGRPRGSILSHGRSTLLLQKNPPTVHKQSTVRKSQRRKKNRGPR